jgi:hypothetical protein
MSSIEGGSYSSVTIVTGSVPSSIELPKDNLQTSGGGSSGGSEVDPGPGGSTSSGTSAPVKAKIVGYNELRGSVNNAYRDQNPTVLTMNVLMQRGYESGEGSAMDKLLNSVLDSTDMTLDQLINALVKGNITQLILSTQSMVQILILAQNGQLGNISEATLAGLDIDVLIQLLSQHPALAMQLQQLVQQQLEQLQQLQQLYQQLSQQQQLSALMQFVAKQTPEQLQQQAQFNAMMTMLMGQMPNLRTLNVELMMPQMMMVFMLAVQMSMPGQLSAMNMSLFNTEIAKMFFRFEPPGVFREMSLRLDSHYADQDNLLRLLELYEKIINQKPVVKEGIETEERDGGRRQQQSQEEEEALEGEGQPQERQEEAQKRADVATLAKRKLITRNLV